MMLTKGKLAPVVLLLAGTLAAGAGLPGWPTTSPQPAEEPGSEKSQLRRDRVGDPLPAGALARLGTIRFRHGRSIDCLGFGADGKTLVTCGWGEVRFWNVASGAEIRRFPEQSRARNVALSPDGKLLAIRVRIDNSEVEPIAIREVATGRLLRQFSDKEFPSRFLFSPDGKVLAAFSRQKGIIELWDSVNGRRMHTLKHEADCWPEAFSTDGKMLLSCTDNTIHSNTIHIWDVATGKELRQIKQNRIREIALSPDGKLLATVDSIHRGWWQPDSRVHLWDMANGRELRQLTVSVKESDSQSPAMVWRMAFAPDGKSLLTGGWDGVLRVWDPATGREIRRIPGFSAVVSTFALAPDGKTLAVVDGQSTVRVFDFATGKETVPLPGHRWDVTSISVTPDGQTIVTSDDYGVLRFWEPATGRELRRRSLTGTGRSFPPSQQLQPDGRTYLTVRADRTCQVRNLADGEELAGLRGHKLRSPVALSPDGKTFAARTDEGKISLLDPATGAARHILNPPKVKDFMPDRPVPAELKAVLQESSNEKSVAGMSFPLDGRTLIVWNADHVVTVWDVASGKKRRQFTAPFQEQAALAAVSPDGELLAFGSRYTAPQPAILHVLDTIAGKEVRRFSTAKNGVSQLAFSPNGKSLAWGCIDDGTVYLGEIVSGRERGRFVGHTDEVRALAFSSDGKMLISGARDTTSLVWDLSGRLAAPEKFGKPLSAADLETHWKALAAEDAAAAYRAVQMLAADPQRSVAYLRVQLHPVAAADEKRLKQWIADLDSDQFTVREKATSELEILGKSALRAMRKALDGKPTLEMRRRLEQLIERQERAEWSPERLRSRRALEVLERAGTAEAKGVLTSLANGAPGAWQTLDAKAALQRLAHRPAGKP